jgi:hypothetical protein
VDGADEALAPHGSAPTSPSAYTSGTVPYITAGSTGHYFYNFGHAV